VLEDGPLLIATNFAGQTYQTWKGPQTGPFDVRNHFWQDRWYNVMRCDKPQAGGLPGSAGLAGLEYYYCNVTTPTMYDGENVRYVDLDLDVRVHADGRIELLDEDEFVENSQRMGYPPEVIEQARRAADELIELARARRFPFEFPS